MILSSPFWLNLRSHKQKSQSNKNQSATWSFTGPPCELQARMKYEGDQL